MSSIPFYMPLRGEDAAPIFNPREPRSLLRFFDDLEEHFRRAAIFDDEEKKRYTLRYLEFTEADFWESLDTFEIGTFEEWKEEIFPCYPGAEPSYCYAELEELVESWRSRGFASVEAWAEFYREFHTISRSLIHHDRLSEYEQRKLCLEAISGDLRSCVDLRLLAKHPDAHEEEGYPIEQINEAVISAFTMRPSLSPLIAPAPPIKHEPDVARLVEAFSRVLSPLAAESPIPSFAYTVAPSPSASMQAIAVQTRSQIDEIGENRVKEIEAEVVTLKAKILRRQPLSKRPSFEPPPPREIPCYAPPIEPTFAALPPRPSKKPRDAFPASAPAIEPAPDLKLPEEDRIADEVLEHYLKSPMPPLTVEEICKLSPSICDQVRSTLSPSPSITAAYFDVPHATRLRFSEEPACPIFDKILAESAELRAASPTPPSVPDSESEALCDIFALQEIALPITPALSSPVPRVFESPESFPLSPSSRLRVFESISEPPASESGISRSSSPAPAPPLSRFRVFESPPESSKFPTPAPSTLRKLSPSPHAYSSPATLSVTTPVMFAISALAAIEAHHPARAKPPWRYLKTRQERHTKPPWMRRLRRAKFAIFRPYLRLRYIPFRCITSPRHRTRSSSHYRAKSCGLSHRHLAFKSQKLAISHTRPMRHHRSALISPTIPILAHCSLSSVFAALAVSSIATSLALMLVFVLVSSRNRAFSHFTSPSSTSPCPHIRPHDFAYPTQCAALSRDGQHLSWGEMMRPRFRRARKRPRDRLLAIFPRSRTLATSRDL